MPDITQTELMDMIAADESPSNISDKIKDLLFAKSAEKVDAVRPDVANTMFQEPEEEEVDEVDTEFEEVSEDQKRALADDLL